MYDVNEIRKQFPMLNSNKTMQGKPLVYLDNCSTTFKPQCVIDAMDKYYKEMTANSHRGDYDLLYQMDMQIEEARKTISKFVNCDSREVVFTSGDTMSLNLVAWGYGIKYLKKGDEILISEAEHASNVLPWYKAAEMTGAVVKFIELENNGEITAKNVKKALTKNTKIVSIAHVGNVLGMACDIKEIAKVCHENGTLIIVDGAQSVPHIKTDFKDWDIDFLTFSAHKLCGPTGIGCLIGKYGLLDKMDPFLTGGGMNAKFDMCGNIEYLNPPAKFESGTLNLSGIMGFKAAVEFIESIGIENIHQHDVELIKYAIDKLEKEEKVITYNKDANGGILTFNIKGIFSQDEATLLNSKGICVRSGQHCAKIFDKFLGTNATCRMSTYLYTSKEEIDAFIDAVINGGDILDAYFN